MLIYPLYFFPFLLVWLTWRTCDNTVPLGENTVITTVDLNALRCADLKLAMLNVDENPQYYYYYF